MNEKGTELIPLEHVKLGALDVRPEAVVQTATNIATALAKVIRERRLFTNIQGKDYVRVEGWSTLGAMLGVLPREVEVTSLADGGFEAVVELVRTSDSAIVGRASALCGMDEKRWAERPAFARRSMAVTRATGKAYRLGFAWIMQLAGYEGTPAEEMDFVEGQFRDAPAKAPDARPVVVAETGEIVDAHTTGEEYRQALERAGFDRETGIRIFNECGRDLGKALDAVEAQTPPADTKE